MFLMVLLLLIESVEFEGVLGFRAHSLSASQLQNALVINNLFNESTRILEVVDVVVFELIKVSQLFVQNQAEHMGNIQNLRSHILQMSEQ